MACIPFARLSAVVAAVAAFLSPPAIGSGEHGHSGGHGADHGGFAAGAPASVSEADRTIRITADEYRFEPETVSVERRQVVRFVVTNQGAQKHNLVVGTPAEQKAHEQEMQRMAEQGGAMDHDDPNAVTVDPGGTEEFTWRFSKDATVRYACHLPGHYEAGMVGTVASN